MLQNFRLQLENLDESLRAVVEIFQLALLGDLFEDVSHYVVEDRATRSTNHVERIEPFRDRRDDVHEDVWFKASQKFHVILCDAIE